MRTEMNKPAGSLGTKRLLAAIAVLAVALAVFAAVPAAEDSDAAGSTVYVDSTIEDDDASKNTYKTLTAAVAAAGENGTIILKSDLKAEGETLDTASGTYLKDNYEQFKNLNLLDCMATS